MEDQIKIAELILDKYYPTERTIWRTGILKAMDEYVKITNKDFSIIDMEQQNKILELQQEVFRLKQSKLQLENVIERWHHNTTKTI